MTMHSFDFLHFEIYGQDPPAAHEHSLEELPVDGPQQPGGDEEDAVALLDRGVTQITGIKYGLPEIGSERPSLNFLILVIGRKLLL